MSPIVKCSNLRKNQFLKSPLEQLNNLDIFDRFHTTLFRGFLCQLTIDRDTRGSGIQMSKIAKRLASITFLTHVLVSMVSMVSRFFSQPQPNFTRKLEDTVLHKSVTYSVTIFDISMQYRLDHNPSTQGPGPIFGLKTTD